MMRKQNKSNEFSIGIRLSKMTEENLQMKRKLQHYEANDAKRSSLGSVKLYLTGEMSSLTNGAIEPTKSIGLNMKVQKLLNAGTSERCIASLRGSNRDPIAALVATPVASCREVFLGRDKVQNHEIARYCLVPFQNFIIFLVISD